MLRVDTRSGEDAEDYYHVRYLVPEPWRKELPELNNRLVITNYHAFEPQDAPGQQTIAHSMASSGPTATKQEASEDLSQVIARVARPVPARLAPARLQR